MSSANSYQTRQHPPPPQGHMLHPPAHSPKHPIHHQSARILELFDALKHEADILLEEAAFSKHHRKDLEAKLSAQVTEIGAFQQSLYELDRIHSKTKQQYEEEIMRLRRELESRGIPISAPTAVDNRQFRKQSVLPDGVPPPNLSNHTRTPSLGAFGNLPAQGQNPSQFSSHAGYPDKPGDLNHPQKRLKSDAPPTSHVVPPRQHRDSLPNVALKPVNSTNQTPNQRSLNTEDQFRQQQEFRQSYHNNQRSLTPPTQHPGQPAPQHPSLQPQHHIQAASSKIAVQTEKSKSDEFSVTINPVLQKAKISVDLLHSFEHGSVVTCVKFSPDGKYIATGCNHFVQIYEIASGRKILALVDESNPKDEDLYIRSVCFSPDGVYLATGAEDCVVRIWDIVPGRVTKKLVGHEQDVYSLEWSKDGKFIVSGSGDGTVKIWDGDSGQLMRTLSNDSDKAVTEKKDFGITSVAIRPSDSRCVVAGSLDEIVRIWDVRTGQLLEKFEGHSHSVYSIAFSPDGYSLVSGSLDQTLRVWDVSEATIVILGSPVNPNVKPDVVINRRSRYIFNGHSDFVLSVGFPGVAGSIGRVDPHGRPIQDPAFDIDWVVSGGKDRQVHFWDARQTSVDTPMSPLITLTGHLNSVISTAVGPIGGLFATGSGDQKARVWRISRSPTAPLNTGTVGSPLNGQPSNRDRRKSIMYMEGQPLSSNTSPKLATTHSPSSRPHTLPSVGQFPPTKPLTGPPAPSSLKNPPQSLNSNQSSLNTQQGLPPAQNLPPSNSAQITHPNQNISPQQQQQEQQNANRVSPHILSSIENQVTSPQQKPIISPQQSETEDKSAHSNDKMDTN